MVARIVTQTAHRKRLAGKAGAADCGDGARPVVSDVGHGDGVNLAAISEHAKDLVPRQGYQALAGLGAAPLTVLDLAQPHVGEHGDPDVGRRRSVFRAVLVRAGARAFSFRAATLVAEGDGVQSCDVIEDDGAPRAREAPCDVLHLADH